MQLSAPLTLTMLGSTVLAASIVAGTWEVMSGQTGSLCIHSLLLPGNKLSCIERPHTSPYPFINPLTNGTTSTLVDISLKDNSISFTLNHIKTNAFCAGHAQMADGGVYVIGGDRQSSTPTHDASKNANVSEPDDQTFLFYGINRVRTFSLEKGWDESYEMSTERWYPTVVTMGDGDAFITSGSKKNLVFEDLSNTNNPTYEFYPRRYKDAITSSILDWAFPHNLYPVAFQMPSGKVFMMVSNRTVLIDPNVDPGDTEANTVNLEPIPAFDHAPFIYPHTPTAFLLPLRESENYTATVMLCGGSKRDTLLASSDCLTFQPDVLDAKWKFVANMPRGRVMPDSAILPDGTVLMTNGAGWGVAGGDAGQALYASAPTFETDMYDPATNTWSTVGKSTIPRLYHSGVLLLEDATVITTGSEMQNYLDFWGTPDTLGPLTAYANISQGVKPECFPTSEKKACTSPYEMRVERFTPAYLQAGAKRPVLASPSAGSKLSYGSTVAVTLDGTAPPAARITLVRYSTTTHSTNTDQRLIEPTLLFANATYVVFKIPGNPNVAPPGNYHLFAVTKDGVPSLATRVLLGKGDVTAVQVPTGGVTVPTVTVSPSKTGGVAALISRLGFALVTSAFLSL
ncbi:hypothetical protein BC830DRAFT_1169954 [Chytriomyces sp. MP71]|nr:hypothetical protein BC830DRAFT_1169954 [Chytriomyces sp. MP71]